MISSSRSLWTYQNDLEAGHLGSNLSSALTEVSPLCCLTTDCTNSVSKHFSTIKYLLHYEE